MQSALNALFLLACAMIFYGGVCRSVAMNKTTLLEIRIAFLLSTTVAAVCAGAVFVLRYEPHWIDTLLAMTYAFVQVVTSRLWTKGHLFGPLHLPKEYSSTTPSELDPPNSRILLERANGH